MKTFEIMQEFDLLRELAEEIEIDENGEFIDRSDAIEELFNDIVANAGDKLEQLYYIKEEIDASMNLLRKEEQRLSKRRKSLENNMIRLRDLQIDLLKRVDGNKVKTDKHTFSLRTTKVVEIDPFVDASMLADEFRIVKYDVNKSALKKALENGQVIAGVSLAENKSLQVR